MASEVIVLSPEPSYAGLRLDKYINQERPDISRTQAQRLIDEQMITVNGFPAKSSFKVSPGDTIKVTLLPPPTSSISPERIPLEILYEDDDVLVIDKPPGMTVHPAPGHSEHTLANAIMSHLSELPDQFDKGRPGIVHRLDKDTSGLIIVAKNNRAHHALTQQFKERTVDKVYLTLVQGRLTPENGIIEAPIGRDRSHREKMAVSDMAHGREARTHYRVIRYIDNYSFLEVKPATGRTHQIRVHLAAIGHPVVGDKTYGTASALLDRQFLHAHQLRFRLPSTGEVVELKSELPQDLINALDLISERSK